MQTKMRLYRHLEGDIVTEIGEINQELDTLLGSWQECNSLKILAKAKTAYLNSAHRKSDAWLGGVLRCNSKNIMAHSATSSKLKPYMRQRGSYDSNSLEFKQIVMLNTRKKLWLQLVFLVLRHQREFWKTLETLILLVKHIAKKYLLQSTFKIFQDEWKSCCENRRLANFHHTRRCFLCYLDLHRSKF